MTNTKSSHYSLLIYYYLILLTSPPLLLTHAFSSTAPRPPITAGSLSFHHVNHYQRRSHKKVASLSLQSSEHEHEHEPQSKKQPKQPQPTGPVHTLILVRHGDSIWNGKYPGCQETFTGWTDVPLSPIGILEAKRSGETLVQFAPCGASGASTTTNANTSVRPIDALFTSTLSRAKMTAHYCWWAYYEKLEQQYSLQKRYQYYNPQSSQQQSQSQQKQKQQQPDPTPAQFLIDHRLNERNYGSLQGLIKSHTESGIHGHSPSDVAAWRRSWYAIPPLLEEHDPRRLEELRRYREICGGLEEHVPRGESLEMVAKERIRPFLEERVTPLLEGAYLDERSRQLLHGGNGDVDGNDDGVGGNDGDDDIMIDEGGTALIVAHANSLRALIGVLCNVEHDPIALKKLEAMKIQTATPLVIRYRRSTVEGWFHAVDSLSNNNSGVDDGDDEKERQAERLPVYPLSSIPLPIRPSMQHRENGDDIRSTASTNAKIRDDSSRVTVQAVQM